MSNLPFLAGQDHLPLSGLSAAQSVFGHFPGNNICLLAINLMMNMICQNNNNDQEVGYNTSFFMLSPMSLTAFPSSSKDTKQKN